MKGARLLSYAAATLVTGAVPLCALAQYVPLVPDIPFIGSAMPGSFTNLLQALLAISVGIAAVLAVVMLAVGGVKYMTTDSAFQLGNAKEQIRDALVGLLIVLTAVLLLKTINPKLISLDVFSGL